MSPSLIVTSQALRTPPAKTPATQSPAARALRILAEYIEPAERLRRARISDTIVFFGSARSGSPEQAAEQLAEINAQIQREGQTTAELAEALWKSGSRRAAHTAAQRARDLDDINERAGHTDKRLPAPKRDLLLQIVDDVGAKAN